MDTTNHGGPAFPVPLNPGETYSGHAPADGMTLRDYCAAKAMQGFCANAQAGMEWSSLEIARAAYAQADAMLVARSAA